MDKLILEWDARRDEAAGRVEITRDAYGMTVWMEGRPLFALDLYHNVRREDDEYLPHAMLVIYNPDTPDDDPLCHIRWLPAQVLIEDGAGMPIGAFPVEGEV